MQELKDVEKKTKKSKMRRSYGKYLFYSYDGDIWWVDIKVIEGLRPKESKK